MKEEAGLPEALESLAHEVIGAAIEVHREIGPGFPESVYQNALGYELELRGFASEPEKKVVVSYKGREVGHGRIDLLVKSEIVVELKVVNELADVHRAQVSAYLKATGLKLGLLFNFNTAVLKDGIKRVIR